MAGELADLGSSQERGLAESLAPFDTGGSLIGLFFAVRRNPNRSPPPPASSACIERRCEKRSNNIAWNSEAIIHPPHDVDL